MSALAYGFALAGSNYNPAEVKPGLLGFAVVAALGVALYFLIRSMNSRVRKIDFEERPGRSEQQPPDGDSPGTHGPRPGQGQQGSTGHAGEGEGQH